MNRRSFLRSLVVGAAGAVVTSALPDDLDPERLLWTPGQKTFFIPEAPKLYQGPAVDWASGGDLFGVRGTFPTINIITQEALKVLENQLAFTRRMVNEAFYRNYARGEFPIPQPGDTIEIRQPRFLGKVRSIQTEMRVYDEYAFAVRDRRRVRG